MTFEAGTLIAQNLRLARMLGEGGMGSVWVADHLTLSTQVAVKFIATQLVANPEALARFTQEATAAARIKSPYVVQAYDHGLFQGQPYIVMELLEGEDLASRLLRSPLGPAELAAILSQACRGLAAAHALGIVHRDVKPSNIFLTQSAGELVVKVLDFGVAKETQKIEPSFKTSTRSMVGTPLYMSPEQIFGKGKVDQRADLWSLAVVAYECLTGALPFDGDALGDLYVAIHAGTYRAPSTFPHVRLPEIDAWFARALAHDPQARFATARELGERFLALAPPGAARADLASLAALDADAGVPGRSTLESTTPSSLPTRPTPRGRAPRSTFLVGAVGAALVALVALIAPVAWVVLHRADPASAPASAAADADTSRIPPPAATPPTVTPPTTAPEPTVAPAPSVEPQPTASAAAPAQTVVVKRAPRPVVSAAPAAPATPETKKRNYGF